MKYDNDGPKTLTIRVKKVLLCIIISMSSQNGQT